MSLLNHLKVFATQEHSCSYDKEKQATTLFVDPNTEVNDLIYRELTDIGFRRSGKHFYRPHCRSCSDCIATRIPVEQISLTKRQKRIINKNSDVSCQQVDSINTDEHYYLFEQYIAKRHSDGDMYPATREQYQEFLVDGNDFSHYTEFRLNGKLIAVNLADKMVNGLSAIYTFFDPEHARRSLGNFAILELIDQTRRLGSDFLYLGYWISNCQKMNYKIDYRPMELLINGSWKRLL
jgi:leucyl-tRNA---protein transferase